jgi:hypothetical protein
MFNTSVLSASGTHSPLLSPLKPFTSPVFKLFPVTVAAPNTPAKAAATANAAVAAEDDDESLPPPVLL